MGADSISRAISFNLFLPHLPAGNNHQQRSSGYAADLLEVAPELPPLCLALLAKFLGVFGLVAAALLAFVPEFLSHRGSPWRLDSNIHFLRWGGLLEMSVLTNLFQEYIFSVQMCRVVAKICRTN